MFTPTNLDYLEGLAYIAQIISAGSIIIITWQLLSSIKDRKIRSEREAGVLSIQQAEKFANEILPESDRIDATMLDSELVIEEKKVFTAHELKLERINNPNLRKTINFVLNDKTTNLHQRILTLLNKLEAMSMIFTCGIGDEELAFPSLGQAFCSIVERYYFVIAMQRDKEIDNPYESLLKLYLIWSSKLNKNDIENKIKKLKEEGNGIPSNHIKTIGT